MSSYRLLVAGSRGLSPGPTEFDLALVLLIPGPSSTPLMTIINGTAPGVDRAGAAWGKLRGWKVEDWPADWDGKGKAAGFMRNSEMVQSGINGAIFFWDGESKGTQHTMGLMNSYGAPYVTIVWPSP